MIRRRRPNWWLLYLTVPLMLGLLVIEGRMPYPLVIHRIAELVIVLFGFGLMFLWVRANEGGLIDEEIEKEGWTIRPNPTKQTVTPARRRSGGCEDAGDADHHPEPNAIKGRYN